MLTTDKDALICDLAETYGIYDMNAYPVRTIATLSAGLRENARIKTKAAKIRMPYDTLILAALFDRVGSLMYMLSDHKGNAPDSLLNELLGIDQQKQCKGFKTVEEFERERQRILAKARGDMHGIS